MRRPILAAALLAAVPAALAAQAPPNMQALLAEQQAALAKLSFMDGIWRGPAWAITPTGRHEVVQTERIGPFLGGSVKVVEGRGYNPDGTVGFNAFGIISYDPAGKSYLIHSYAQGRAGDFPFRPTASGYVWETPAGPGAIVRYTAKIGGGNFREVGELVAAGAPPRQIFEMNLKRVGDTKWPEQEPVPMR